MSTLVASLFVANGAQAQTSGAVVYARDDFDVRCYFTTATADPDCVTDANGVTSLSSSRNGGTYSFTARAEASVGGAFRAQATATVSNVTLGTLPGSGRYQAQARAEVFDQVILSGTTTPAFLRFFVTIDGFAGQSSRDPRAPSSGQFRLTRYASAPINGSAFDVPSVVFGATRVAPTDGTPLETFIDIPLSQGMNYLLFGLVAAAQVGAPEGTLIGDSWSGNAWSDYFNTATITGTRIVNAQGNVIEGAYANFSGASNLNVVPEPRTYALMAVGLFGVMVVRRRRS